MDELQRLPAGSSALSHHYHRATLVQSDLIGFTRMASLKPPEAVVKAVSDLFGLFDGLADEYGIYKVETVGDAYIAGQAEPPLTLDNYPPNVIRFGLKMIGATKKWSSEAWRKWSWRVAPWPLWPLASEACLEMSVTSPPPPRAKDSDETIGVRVGVHSGECIGGIVGIDKQRYHLFGQLIHQLELLESTAPENGLQVSSSCKAAVEAAWASDTHTHREENLSVSSCLRFDFVERPEKHLVTSKVTWVAKTPLLPARNQNDLREWLCQRLVVEAVRLRFSARWRSGVIPCTLHSYDSAREAVTITTLTIMVEPSRWQDRCEEVLQEVLTITRHGIAEEELALAKRMCLDRVAEAAASQPWSFMGTLYGYDAAGTSREIVEALIASTPTGHLLTSATRFHEALRQAASRVFRPTWQDIDVAQFNDSLQSVLGFLGPAENVPGVLSPSGAFRPAWAGSDASRLGMSTTGRGITAEAALSESPARNARRPRQSQLAGDAALNAVSSLTETVRMPKKG
eukprot:g17148.t1